MRLSGGAWTKATILTSARMYEAREKHPLIQARWQPGRSGMISNSGIERRLVMPPSRWSTRTVQSPSPISRYAKSNR